MKHLDLKNLRDAVTNRRTAMPLSPEAVAYLLDRIDSAESKLQRIGDLDKRAELQHALEIVNETTHS